MASQDFNLAKMEIHTQKIGDSYTINLHGELDASTAEYVEKTLDEVVSFNPSQIQVDCKGLKYISSRGLGVFISRFQEIQEKQIEFFLFNLSEQILYVFQVLGLDELMDLRADQTVKN